MKHETSGLLQLIKKLNSDYWLPAIQREFVWKEAQICKLFDSLMRHYPIGSFLIWETKNPIRKRKFCENWHKLLDTRDLFLPSDENTKKLILDGQQRLTALLIGCSGTFSKKKLHFNITSRDGKGVTNEISDVLYDFLFLDDAKKKDWNWVSFQAILEMNLTVPKAVAKLKKELDCDGFRANVDLITDNIALIQKRFKYDQNCAYVLLSNIECGDDYDDNDVVEIFVRANSGGTKLEKSELLFALLASKWDVASDELGELESSLQIFGFEFTRDYFLKACLMLLGKKAQYDVKKFRNEETLEALQKNWDSIKSAISSVIDFLPKYTPISSSKALPSRNALLPLIAHRYHFEKEWRTETTRDIASQYLLKTAVAGTFNGAKDDLLDGLYDVFVSNKDIDLNKAYEVIASKNRSISISEEQFFDIQYQSNKIPFVMKLIFPDLSFRAADAAHFPHIDHLFSRKVLKKSGQLKAQIDQLANLAPLEKSENQSKSGKILSVWLGGMTPSEQTRICKKLLIPTDNRLWEESRFEDFIKARRKLILEAPGVQDILGDIGNEDGEEG